MDFNDPTVLKVAEALCLNGTERGKAKVEAYKKLLDENKGDLSEYSKNANEVIHTGNTGFGAELIPTEILQAEIFDVVPKWATFLNALPGFHGFNMGKTESVPILGDTRFFQGNSEWTTGAGALSQGTKKPPTAKATVEQAPFIMSVDISRRELNYAVGDLEGMLKNKIAASWARTAEAAIVNGDTETGGTGNVNSDDQAPATTFATEGGAAYYALLIDHGLRELAINGSSLTVNAGTLDLGDFLDVRKKLGEYMSDPSSLMWLMNAETYNKSLGLQAFYDASQRGKPSTVAGNPIMNLFGSDLFIARDYGLAEADGKQSGATPAGNTLGGFACFWKPAVQFGYGQQFEIDVVKVPGQGVQIIATVEFGFDIVQLLAGFTSSSVGAAINVTV